MRLGSLFSGIGGFDLAARWMGWETAWFSEIDPYASAVLARHWPGVPNHGDIARIDFTAVEPVRMVCGGFPCQGISDAGERKGMEDERSGLWGEYARAIGELRPGYVVVENVAALAHRGLGRVLGDLAALGYDAEWTVLSAADAGAPHLRERLWIVAYPQNNGARWGLQLAEGGEGAGDVAHAEGHGRQQGRPEPAGIIGRPDAAECGGALAHTHGAGPAYDCQGNAGCERLTGRNPAGGGGRSGDVPHAILAGLEGDVREVVARAGFWRSDANLAGPDRWTAEPDVGRVAHGIPKRVDRLRGLGNAIVPQCAFMIFQAIARYESLARPTGSAA